MNLRIITSVVALTAAVGCSSMKVSQDYDRQADFSGYETYSWHEGEHSVADTDPLAHERFIKAIDGQLAAKGFRQVSSNPDVYITYNAEETEQMSLDTTYMGGGWGYGPGWGWGGMGLGSTTTTVRKYRVGTVVLDMWDAQQKRLVWRGVVSDTVSTDRSKNASKIQKAAQKLFRKYPPSGK